MKMREIIRIVEGKHPTDPAILYRLAEIVNDFVSHGPVPDDMMDEIMRNWPRPQASMTLWRAHVLSKPQAAQLKQGLTLPVHRYLSWTNTTDTLGRLAAARSHMGIPVIIKMTFPPEEICIDVQQFVSDLYGMEGNFPEMRLDFDLGDVHQYEDEAEVIVAHHHPLRLSSANTTVFKHLKSVAPKVGDRVYPPHVMAEDSYAITAVLGKNRDGTWKVAAYDGEVDVHNIAPGEWEIVERYG